MENNNNIPEWAVELEEKRARREAVRKAENAEFYKLMNRVITYTALGFASLLVFLWSALYILSR